MAPRRASAEREPLIIAVGGGKGGVGKSVVSLNLAVAMAKLGARVIAVDADLGSANLHTMLGVDRPGPTLQAWLDGRVQSLAEVCVPTDFANLTLVPGSVAVPGAANLHHARKMKLMRHFAQLDTDIVVLDCGAGIHFNVIDCFAAAHVQLLVANAQLISLQNAYGFLKACVYRMLRQHAQGMGKAELFELASDQSEVETLEELLRRVAADDVALADELRDRLATFRFSLLGNQLLDAREQNAILALSRMIRDFLGLDVAVLGGLLRKDRIHAAVTRRRPFILEANDQESRLIFQIAESYLDLQRTAKADHVDYADRAARAVDPAVAERAQPSARSRYQRAHERLDVDWAAAVEINGARQTGRVLDISHGGMKLELPKPCTTGSHLRVVLTQKSGLGLFSVRVVNGSGLIAGCVFEPEPSKAGITELLERASAETAVRRRGHASSDASR